jgi:hypothetical protein
MREEIKMGTIAYKKFLKIDVTHDFYLTGISQDLSIVPTIETQQVFRNQKMIYKGNKSGAFAYYRSVSTTDANPAETIPDTLYTFAASIADPGLFMNVSNLSDGAVKYRAGNIVYLRNNTTTSNTLNYELLNRILPLEFNYNLSHVFVTGDVVELKVLNAAGTEVYLSDPLVKDDAGRYQEEVKLKKYGPGKYTIQEIVTNGSGTTIVATEKIYVDSNLATQPLFAIIAIEWKASLGFTFLNFVSQNPFATDFKRRIAKWKYYIVNGSGVQSAAFTNSPILFDVHDSAPAPIPSPYANSYSFTPAVAVADINGHLAISMQSTVAIPFYEQPRAGFELRLLPTLKVLIPSLSNATTLRYSDETPALPSDPDIVQIFVFI